MDFAGVVVATRWSEPAKTREVQEMKRSPRGFAAAGSLFLTMFGADAAFAQKQGGF